MPTARTDFGNTIPAPKPCRPSLRKSCRQGGKKYHKEFDTVNEMLEYWKKYTQTHNDITKTDFQRLIFCKDVKMYFILRNYNLVLARVTPARTIQ